MPAPERDGIFPELTVALPLKVEDTGNDGAESVGDPVVQFDGTAWG